MFHLIAPLATAARPPPMLEAVTQLLLVGGPWQIALVTWAFQLNKVSGNSWCDTHFLSFSG